MKQVQIFKVLTYLLIPIALLFSFMALLVLPTALVNPALLLVVFIFSCIAIYTFSSLRFVTTAINKAKNCNPSLKDWIKINGYISVGTAFMFLLNSIGILMLRPIEFNDFVNKAMETQASFTSKHHTCLCRSNAKVYRYFYADHEHHYSRTYQNSICIFKSV